jgi:glyoxylase I family protein
MLVTDIHHVSINVTETARALDFYVGVLGMELLPRPEISVKGAWLGAGPQRQLHLIEAPVPPDQGQHFAFVVSDIDATVATLQENGCKVRGPFEIADTGARQAFFFDPDGNRLELNQPASN